MNARRFAYAVSWTMFLLLFGSGIANAQCSGNAFGYCADCTTPTPCCGYGPCNIFCFNCDGGCRQAPSGDRDPSCGSMTRTDAVGDAIRGKTRPAPELKPAREAFDGIDTSNDGTISFTETKAWAKRENKGLSRKELKAGFGKADADGDGKIQPAEFDRSLAGSGSGY
ncbi:MAG TPA: EF-hand domain-containing protein [Tahibacter sp.]|uniref:EF-hand domain-containing protein n=1 Tax=Tahibacter sp. TaxID=2056211 RepID=UPI002C11D105|nr:EF-hand domain-containing protein [Tahibacter sp.]HSX62095.1 EF-hand domain-containing protein [Tahibacter sp.]